jgi:hypothetical protein
MDPLVSGVIATTCAVAGLLFLRFWRDSRDRLFGLFAVALFALAANRIMLALAPQYGLSGHLYWTRLLAFGLILVAIVDKNLPRGRAGRTDSGNGSGSR